MVKKRAVMEVNLPFKRLGTGKNKVREMYDLSEIAPGIGLMVNTDRISTEDVVMHTGIPGKGKVLTKISAMMFEATRRVCPNHFITDDYYSYPIAVKKELAPYREELLGRSMLILLEKPA
jgi:phosphoribosylaminoimidazole-succinocarboxamide synthase